jgi:NDP-4-keto-2,6-dideoxyhexose 3-C-methyltransferase
MRITECRSCHKPLPSEPVFSLGEVPVIEFPSSPEGRGLVAPLDLVECPACELVQLKESVDADLLFRDFWYRSGVTGSMKQALRDIVESAITRANLEAGDAVLDIGTNDGTLLEFYDPNLLRVGFEPARDLAKVAAAKGLTIFPDYFTVMSFIDRSWLGRFKVITAISMFYDLDDPGEFLEAVKLALEPQGIFIVQMNYLGTMLQNLCVDNICHEHVAYYSVRSFSNLIEKHGMTITGIEMNDVNGGSARFYIQSAGETPSSVKAAIAAEAPNNWPKFCLKLNTMRQLVIEHLSAARKQGKRLAICGASTRGLTLLHFLGLGHETFSCAGDRDSRKHGRYYGNTGIPIVSEQEARENADVMLVLPWHFAREIIEREQAWLQAGGELVFPLPKPRVVKWGGTKSL